MKQVFVKPVEGALVRIPEENMEPIPAEGREVLLTATMRRHIANGSLVIVKKSTEKTVTEVEKTKDQPTENKKGK